MILGFLSKEQGLSIKELISTGQGLAFVSYPTAIAKFGAIAPLVAVALFKMMMDLGMNHCSGQHTLSFFKIMPNSQKIHFFLIRINEPI